MEIQLIKILREVKEKRDPVVNLYNCPRFLLCDLGCILNAFLFISSTILQ